MISRMITGPDIMRLKLPHIVTDVVASGRAVLAGGSLLRVMDFNHASDLDLFVTSDANRDLVNESILSAGYRETFRCPVGKLNTWKKGDEKVQVINETRFDSVPDLIDTFDLVPAVAGTDLTTVWMHDEWLGCFERLELKLHKVTYPVATMGRIIKYAAKGFRVPPKLREDYIKAVLSKDWQADAMRTYID